MTAAHAIRALLLALFFLSSALHSQAQSIWSGAGSNNNWTTAQNWEGGTAPSSGPGAWIVLRGAVRPTPLVDGSLPWVLNRLEFRSTSTGYETFTLSGNQLSFQGASPLIYTRLYPVQIVNNDIDIPQGTLAVDGYAIEPIDFKGKISGNGGLSFVGPAILSASNTYTGKTTTAWHLEIRNAAALGSVAEGTIVNEGSIRLSGNITVVGEPLSLSGYSPGFGLVNWSGNNKWTGDIVLTHRSYFTVPNAGETLEVSGTVDANNQNLGFSGNGTIIISGPIVNATGELRKRADGALKLTGKNSIPGWVIVEGGTLVVGGGDALSDTGSLSMVGEYISTPTMVLGLEEDETIGNLWTGFVIVELGANTLTVNQTDLGVCYGQINGTGGMVKAGSGRLVLGHASTFTGGTWVTSGILSVNQDAALGAPSSSLTLNGGTLQCDNNTSVSLSQNRSLRLAGLAPKVNGLDPNGQILTIGGEISGPGTLTKVGDGKVRLSYSANSYAGGTAITLGPVQFDFAGSIGGSGPNVLVNYNGVAIAGYPIDQAFLNRIDPASVGIVALNTASGNDLDFGAAGLTSVYLGANGTQIFSGTLAAAGGTYRLGGNAGTLELTRLNAISGAGSLEAGYQWSGLSGTVVLSNDNTLGGNVAIRTGKLKVNASALAFAQADDWGTLELANAILAGTIVTVEQPGLLTGCGTINADLVNNGQVSLNCGDFVVNGSITNNGTISLYGGAVLIANGSFVNNGVLDLLTSPNTVLPPGFVNNGTVIQFGQAKVRSVSRAGSTFTLVVQSLSGHNYQLQRSPILPGTNWQDVGTARAGTGADISLTDSSGGRMFYRVQISP